MRPCSSRINVAARTQKLDVDNHLSLRIYYRIADNLLRQAAIFRNEKNVIDLYIMLLRFSGLVTETIPRHRDYIKSPQTQKDALKKQFLNALNELEQIKPAVRKRIEDLERKQDHQTNPRSQSDNGNSVNSFEWPLNKKQHVTNNLLIKVTVPASSNIAYEDPKYKQQLHMFPPKEQFHRLVGENFNFIDGSILAGIGKNDVESLRGELSEAREENNKMKNDNLNVFICGFITGIVLFAYFMYY